MESMARARRSFTKEYKAEVAKRIRSLHGMGTPRRREVISAAAERPLDRTKLVLEEAAQALAAARGAELSQCLGLDLAGEPAGQVQVLTHLPQGMGYLLAHSLTPS